MSAFESRSTALVLIDLQNGIVGQPWEPHDSAGIVARSRTLADRFRAAGAPVVLVRVAFAADFADAPGQNVDQPVALPKGGLPPEWSQLVEGLAQPGDLLITKRQWGAFHGTELDLQLRRRGIKTVVLGGIATNIGVESTALQAWEHGYDLVLAEDLCAGPSAELHAMAFKHIFPRLSRVMRSDAIALAAS
ncbi:MAG TPA: hydrolase [Candidatus Sulfotelmatobacter sp.]|jgi:nicotinamidase-related amidase|nr:hydrolase [Candidatus Sulfotelmatobacter sp.]